MGAYAFANCTNMTSAIIGNNLTQWNNEWGENRCFGYNTSLRYVEIAEGANSIGNNAFSGCTALETVVLPKTITEWGSNIFEDCSEILTVFTSDSRTKEKLKDYSVSVSDEAPEAPEAVPVTVSVNISDESDGTGIVSPAGEISRDADSTVYVKVVPDRGSLIDNVTVGGKVFREITDTGIVAFVVDQDTELSVTFTEDPEYEDEYPPLDGEEDISPDADNEEDASPDIDDEDADVDSMPEDEDIDVDDAPEDEDADVDDMPKDEDVLTDSEESGNTSVLFSDEDELTLELTKDGLTITDETQQLTFLLEDLGLDPDDWEDGYLSQAKDRNGTEHWYLNNADDTARTQISGKEFVTE